MDFVCFCNMTFTLGSSLVRHFKSCKVAEQRVLQADGQSAASKHDSPSSLSGPITRSLANRGPSTPLSSDLQPYEPQQREHHEQQSSDHQSLGLHQSYLHATADQHREFLRTITEQHLHFLEVSKRSSSNLQEQHERFMQSMMQTSSQQHQENQKSAAELLRTLGEQFLQMSKLSQQQSYEMQQSTEKQNALTRRSIED
ncbi:hypothetical protein BGZ98_006113, partial [Dissophora globulifera]